MGTGATVAVTLAGLVLTLAGVLLAAKQVHLQLRPRQQPVLTFGLEVLAARRYRVTAKNGGDATARHVVVWLKDSASGNAITDPAKMIGSLLPRDTIETTLEALPTYQPSGSPELWYAWESVDHVPQGPTQSRATPQESAADWIVRDHDQRQRWSLAFVFDTHSDIFHWGLSHTDIFGRLGAHHPASDAGGNLIAGRVYSDWTVEIYDRRPEVREERATRQLAVERAPRSPSGDLSRSVL